MKWWIDDYLPFQCTCISIIAYHIHNSFLLMCVIPKFITCTVVVFWLKFCWWPLTTKYFKISTGWRLKWTYVGVLIKLLILSLNFIDIESQIFQVHFLKPPSPSLFWFRYFVNKQILLYLELVVITTVKK